MVHDSKSTIADVLISDHGNWRHLHWQALQSAYGESPFFEYYEDDLRPFFAENKWERLLDYNDAICAKMCELLDIQPMLIAATNQTPADFRAVINPKHPLPDADFQPKAYYQVYQQKHGFLPNLRILDLLFNMGPESVFFLFFYAPIPSFPVSGMLSFSLCPATKDVGGSMASDDQRRRSG